MSDQKYPSINIGSKTRYPDIQGGLHRTPSEAISENQRLEPDFSRGASGGCSQDPSKVPGGKDK